LLTFNVTPKYLNLINTYIYTYTYLTMGVWVCVDMVTIFCMCIRGTDGRTSFFLPVLVAGAGVVVYVGLS